MISYSKQKKRMPGFFPVVLSRAMVTGVQGSLQTRSDSKPGRGAYIVHIQLNLGV